MSWFGARAVIAAVATAAAVVSAGLAARSAARGAVERAREDAIDAAALEARRRIATEAETIAAQIVQNFMRSTALKGGVAGLLFVALLVGALSGPLFSALLGAALFVLAGRDFIRAGPTLRILTDALRAHRWRPKTALAEVVAAETMARALAEAEAAATQTDRRGTTAWRERLALAVAGIDRGEVAQQVAAAVADVARRTAWRDIKPIVTAAALRIALGAVVYAALIALALTAAGA